MQAVVPAVVPAEKSKLQRHFGRWELLTCLVCSMVGLDTIGSVAQLGAPGFTWLIFLAVAFLLPYGLLTAELGSAFPQEGGAYVWVRDAFGRPAASLTTLFYWVSNPIWMGGTLVATALATWNVFFFPVKGLAEYLFGLVFIWFIVAVAMISVKYGRWVGILGALSRMVILPFFALSVVLYAMQHGVHGFPGTAFLPSYAGFIAAVPILVYNYVGFEVPSAAGEEMKDPQRDVPRSVASSGIWTVLLYGIPSLAILLVLPAEKVTGLGSFLDASKLVFTVWGGHVSADGAPVLTGWGELIGDVSAFVFIFGLASSGATWLMGGDRMLAVAAQDGAAPRILGVFSERQGTPLATNVLSGVVASLTMIVAMRLANGNSAAYFAAVLGLVVSTTTLSYVAVFPSLIALRRLKPDVPRPYRVPGGNTGAWLCSVFCTFWALLATVCLVWPGFGIGWFGTPGNPDESLPEGFAGKRLDYELTQIIPLVFLLLLGWAFYAIGRRSAPKAGPPVSPAVEPAP